MTSTTIKATMGQQCCLQLSAHQQCCQAHSCHAHQAMFFIFFIFFFFFLFSCFALSHILNVYCNRFCFCCCRCQPHLATLAKVWEGRGEQSCQAGLGSLGFMATLHCKTGATFSALLSYTPAWALHSKAVINNLITDFVSVRHKQH